MKKNDRKKKKSRFSFGLFIIILLALFIGKDYIFFKILEKNHHYTIGYITDYKHYMKGKDKIEYFFWLNDRKYEDHFNSDELSDKLVGQKIIIKFHPRWPKLSEPIYQYIICDSIQIPKDGWKDLPEIKTVPFVK